MTISKDNRNYYVVNFAGGASANTFTSAVQFNAKYDKVFVRRQTMASICTIYPQVALTNTSGAFFRVILPQNTNDGPIASAVTSVLTLETNVSGYFCQLDHVGQFPFLRFECASLPTASVAMHVFTGKRDNGQWTR